jgi:hypothetical protein
VALNKQVYIKIIIKEIAMKIIENAIIAANIWNEIKHKDKEKFSRYFHIRPTNSGFTLVSLNSYLPMRGLHPKTPKDLESNIILLLSNLKKITSVDTEAAKKYLLKLGFEEKAHARNPQEDEIQAKIIRTMNDNDNLFRIIGVDKIKFITSELILEQKNTKIDIVGMANNKLLLFEIKRGRTKKTEQLYDYVVYYNKNIDKLKYLLSVYPINNVPSFDKIEGIMVMKFAENSLMEKWQKSENKYNIKIIFFEDSYIFRDVNYI